MELFHKFYNSDVQFLLELCAFNRPFSREEVLQAAERCCIYAPYGNLWDGVKEHIDLGMIQRISGTELYQVNALLHPFSAPLNTIEDECLHALCETQEAQLLLSEEVRAQFPAQEESIYHYISTHSAAGKANQLKKLSQKTVRAVLQAIREGRRITYRFCTNRNGELRPGSCIPFRVEVSGFDGRWWLISYLPEEDRPIKSRLANLSEVMLGEKHHIAEETIRQGIEKKLVPEKVVLRIAGSKKLNNTLERCFITFENMLDLEASKLSDEEYEIRFRCFQWDEKLIVRKLLWLGGDVTAIAPKEIVEDMLNELKATLERMDANILG